MSKEVEEERTEENLWSDYEEADTWAEAAMVIETAERYEYHELAEKMKADARDRFALGEE